MSADPRPRRSTRPTAKVPVVLTAAASSTNGGPSKRSSRSEEEDKSGVGGGENFKSPNEETMEIATKPRGKTSTTKPNPAETRLHDIDFILTSPKSPLVNMDISGILNHGTWTTLSLESRARLCKLLPAAAFGENIQDIDDTHPSKRPSETQTSNSQPGHLQIHDEPMEVEDEILSSAKAADFVMLEDRSLDPSYFRDPHFESAARTFQDHLYSGWLTPAHHELVEKHLSGVRDGTLHVPWKDDAWDQDHPEENNEAINTNDAMGDPSSSIGIRTESRRVKESKICEFGPLVRKNFLKEGDVITLKHKFNALGITVEKDALISAIHPKTSVLTLTTSSSTTRNLPTELLVPYPKGPSDLTSLREMTVSTAALLVAALLDIDGRIPRAQRPRLDTWKVLSVWQWASESELHDMSPEEAMLLERGGRESLGTLFYLRGQTLDD